MKNMLVNSQSKTSGINACGVALFLLLTCTPCFADGAYKWTDANGQVHYGSSPPKGAKNVQNLSSKSFSRYSTSKLLGGFRKANSDSSYELDSLKKDLNFGATVNEAEHEELQAGSLGSLSERKPPSFKEESRANKRNDKTSRAKLSDKREIVEQTLLDPLQEKNLSVKHDAQNQVTECSVEIHNSSSVPANNVLVNFEWNDGTLVPGAGPESINAKSSAKFIVPKSLLPISISGVSAGSEPPQPKVFVSGG